jgi:hypothetical protein
MGLNAINGICALIKEAPKSCSVIPQSDTARRLQLSARKQPSPDTDCPYLELELPVLHNCE